MILDPRLSAVISAPSCDSEETLVEGIDIGALLEPFRIEGKSVGPFSYLGTIVLGISEILGTTFFGSDGIGHFASGLAFFPDTID
jgi:hypothetical protein